ncbi:MAG TPA: LysR family transcriptional regulator [Labilithrix sp.]|nr:LysR family transcriptional regulator [Labilithrix sp.]
MDGSASLRSDWLHAFVSFAEHLNFTRAARALHLSQPALHVQIAKLSEALGVPLYTRRGRALELTREGTKLVAFARETQERSSEFVADLRGGSSAGPVVLCAGEGTYLYLLGDAIRAFAKRRTATLRLLTRDRSGTLDAVASGEAHLGVSSLDVAPDGIVAEPLCDVEQVVVVSRSHPLARKRTVTLTDLEGASLVVPPEGRPHRAMISRGLQAAGVSWSVAAEANGWGLILHFAALGVGSAIVNGFCRIPTGMVARPLRGLPPVRYSLLTRNGAHPSGRVEILRRIIQESTRTARGRSTE